MSELQHFDVIVIGGDHAGRDGAVVDCLEWQFAPASARAKDGAGRVSRRGQDARADKTSVPACQTSI
ncbi:MAG: hypothetical protein QM661_08075 [Solimonas sp.]